MIDHFHHTIKFSTCLCIGLLTAFTACGLLGSDDPNPLQPGPRNYSWQVDSVYSAPGGWINDVWGSAPDNVWAISSGGIEKMWHYDGNKWSKYLKQPQGSFYSIYGFSPDNIWVGGNDGKIYHFDGKNWSESYTYVPNELSNIEITDIWGTSASDLYAIGNAEPKEGPFLVSFVLHYNGNIWNELFITDFAVQFQRIRKESNMPFIRAIKYSPTSLDTFLVYQFSNGRLKELESKTSGEVQTFSMNNVGKKIYFYADNELLTYVDSGFKSIKTFSDLDFIVRVDGRNKKDLFLHTKTKVLHYNGEEKISFFEDLPRNVFRSQLFSEDVFFVIRDYNNVTNLIYRGTLTEQEK